MSYYQGWTRYNLVQTSFRSTRSSFVFLRRKVNHELRKKKKKKTRSSIQLQVICACFPVFVNKNPTVEPLVLIQGSIPCGVVPILLYGLINICQNKTHFLKTVLDLSLSLHDPCMTDLKYRSLRHEIMARVLP